MLKTDSNDFSLLSPLRNLYLADGYLFDLDHSNVCGVKQKNGSLIRKCLPISQKIYKITKRPRTPDEVE